MKSRMHKPGFLHAGFTLIEIMVGMGIGMLGIIVMMQVFLLSESNKRATSGGGDAQTNGTSALYALQRDIRQAGYGVTALPLSGCNLLLRTGVTLNVVAPMTINHASIPAGDAGSDTVLLVTGNSNGTPEGDAIISKAGTNVYLMSTPTSFAVNDRVVAEAAVRPTPCNLVLDQVTAVAANVTTTTGVAAIANGTMYNLGATPRVQAYAVRDGSLTVCDYMSADCGNDVLASDQSVWTPIADGVVSMRIQYGRDTSASMDAIVDAYDQITPGSAADVSGLPLNCAIARVQAARLVLVVRNAQMEKTAVTTAAPTWSGSAAAAIDLSMLSDGSPNPDWQKFRYKVFQTVVPLRNVVGLGAQSGC